MKLPNGDRAIVEIEKLRRYCLDPSHPRGRHKARVFMAALGISSAEAEDLRRELLGAAAMVDVEVGRKDKYGTRYTFDLQFSFRAKSAAVRSRWIVKRDDEVPRLVSCYVA